jgi:hypothetical protein
VHHLDSGHVAEKLGRQMHDAALAARRVGKSAGFRLAERDQILGRFHRQRRMDHDQQRPL